MQLLKSALPCLALISPVTGQESTTPADDKKERPRLRLICVSSLQADQKVMLASRDEKGEWLELGKAGLRAPFITDWLPARKGETLHLTIPESDGPKSICSFKYPANSRRLLVVLIADPVNHNYRASVFDPEKIDFAKGSVLVVNFSTQSGIVALGTKRVMVKSGEKSVIKPALEENGMYRMLVAYQAEDKKTVPCYDRYLQGNPDSRDLMFLFPDPSLGLRVFTLPIFGSFE
jgi:hypothetical protein